MDLEPKLIFVRPADGTGRLTFGDDSVAAAPATSVGLDAEFDEGDASDDAIQLLWDANVSRGERHAPRSIWEMGAKVSGRVAAAWQVADHVQALTTVVGQAGLATSSVTESRWQTSERVRRRASDTWERADPVASTLWVGWQRAEALRHNSATRTQLAIPARHTLAAPFQTGVRLRHVSEHGWEVAGRMPARLLRHLAGPGLPLRVTALTAWQTAARPAPGVSVYVPPPPDPEELCYNPDALGTLVFDGAGAPGDGKLIFVCVRGADPELPPGTIVIPILREYNVTNTTTLVRASDGAPIRFDNLVYGLDYTSWTWTFSMSVDPAHEALVRPNTELIATTNGTPIRLRCATWDRDRTFNSRAISVTGLGHQAILGEEYAPQQYYDNASPRTMAQLAAYAMEVNGVAGDFSVEWTPTDWEVPAHGFIHRGTPASALNVLAAAPGGYLLPHAYNNTFKVMPKYPTPPWEWADVSPDIVLPSAVVTREGLASRSSPTYTRAFVSGVAGGSKVRVTRAGTSGTSVAPEVVDPLITAPAAGLQRGIAILSDTGAQTDVVLRLPVLGETGIILPGTFVRYTDEGDVKIGLVRKVSVEHTFPEVWQTIGVETHDA